MSKATETQSLSLPLLATTETCSGRIYIVTGANTGLGFEAAKHLVELGAAQVILGVRNVGAGETAKAEIEEATGKIGVAEVWALDLDSYDSIKAFAKRATELDHIDALIENAGVAAMQRSMAEGHFVTVTVNVLSTLLLAGLLLPKMRKDAHKSGVVPHISFVISRVAFDSGELWQGVKGDPLVKMDDENIVPMKMYPLSKLVTIIAVRQLAALNPLSRSGVVMNLVCPGLCKTSLSRHAPPAFRESLNARKDKFGRTAEVGSRTLLAGAVAGEASHGCFMDSCKVAEDVVPSWITNEDGKKWQKHTWDVISEELEAAEPGFTAKASPW